MISWLGGSLEFMGNSITSVWDVVSGNATVIQALATVIAAVIAFCYLVATRKLWRETRASNLLKQLEYSPDVFVSVENASKFGYMLVFSNQSRLGVRITCDMFVDFAGSPDTTSPIEKSTQPVRHLGFNLASGATKKIRIDTFFELAKRGLGQYAPHRVRIEGIATLQSSQRQGPQITRSIREEFYCVMNNQTNDFIPGDELLDPDKWEWAWLVFNLSEKHTVPSGQVQPWPEEKLPEEYRPSNNNTKLYMRKRLERQYGELLSPGSQDNDD